MALTTTAGAADADAFISLAFATAYHASRGNDDWSGAYSDYDRETAIRRATAYLSSAFHWAGAKANGRSQALAWPRYGVVDPDGHSVDSATIPAEIQHATAEVALIELLSPGAMAPNIDRAARIKREKVGPIETEYFESAPNAYRPALPLITDLIGGLLSGSLNRLSGAVARA